jgi:replicative DNA helicase
MGAASGLKIVTQECRMANKNAILHVRDALRESGGNVIIVQYPPDEINVDTIYSKIDELHRHHKGFTPDIIIIDYLELLIGRHKADNVDNYLKQKAVATQTRGLAHNTNTCIFTATQTNRAGNEKMLKGESIDQSQIAESFGKAMPIDYLISINPIGDSKSGDEIKDVQLYIAKNRNGPTYKDVQATMNMASMTMKSKM